MAKYITPVRILLLSILTYYIYNHYKTYLAPLLSLSPIRNELASDRCKIIKGITKIKT
jgi:hypothetical protein